MTADRDAAWWRTLRRRIGTSAGVQRVAVPNGATSVAVTFARPEPDAAFSALATPTWLTTVAVTSPTRTGCTLTFGTAPGAAAACTLMLVREG